jgi:phage shock protein A
MGIFSRLSNVFRIRANAALDKAEDPGQVIDYAYSTQIEQLQNLRRSIADVVTNETRVKMLASHIEQQSSKLDQQAVQAVQLEREDLARQALQKKETLLAQLSSYRQQIEQLQEQQERLIVIERQVSARVDAFRTQKDMVKTQYSAAQAQVKIDESITGISEEMTEMNSAMQRAQDKVLSVQARANAMEILVEQGTLEDPGLLGSGSEDTLDHELRQISTQNNVDAQLQAIKQQLQSGAMPKQIDGPAT